MAACHDPIQLDQNKVRLIPKVLHFISEGVSNAFGCNQFVHGISREVGDTSDAFGYAHAVGTHGISSGERRILTILLRRITDFIELLLPGSL